MDHIVLLKIDSLHARIVEEVGLKIRLKQREVHTGTIAACLDETALPPENLGLLNVTTGAIRLRWSIIATLPLLADATARGLISEKESGQVRVSFDESGHVLEDGGGFDATGGGSVAPGSIFGGVHVEIQSNFVRTVSDARKSATHLTREVARGGSVRCALIPESYLDLTMPKSLGGGKQRIHLVGGFVLTPLMTLGHPTTKRAKR